MDLVISDIHADIDALESILHVANSNEFKEKYGPFSRIINLGDVLERGTHPKQVLEKLDELSKNYQLESVIGNHDEAFLYGRKVSGSSLESLDAHFQLDKNDLNFFKENTDKTFGTQQFIDKKNNLICVHGGPIDPDKITPVNAGEESWLYQRSWQRLSEEELEFFSYTGYHYKPQSAFSEGKNHLDNFVIFCGHQHMEAAIAENAEKPLNILSKIKPQKEKIEKFTLTKREISIEPKRNYIIRVGLGGPEGYYGTDMTYPHFGIIEYNPKKITLFTIQTMT
ncbi:MAG: metallophosphoesterase family protein [Nitrosopumilaceae archaeon]